MGAPPDTGWARNAFGRKLHYWVEGVSLCRLHLHGSPRLFLPHANAPRLKLCKRCAAAHQTQEKTT